ncbi:hypothetical protein [Haloarchaeobius sp. DFWS5]|uniref:hypothetical protein n=1 Tax=Haloarchaeobius sp. DFWS5 TaxID=3446114 RepID=UPI003EC0E636
MTEYEHIMYASDSHISQLFSEHFGDVSQIEVESTEEISSTVEGKLGALVASLNGDVSGGVSTSEIKKMNFDDDLFQIKAVVNELVQDDSIPQVSELGNLSGNLNSLYRFSSEVILTPAESPIDDENYVEVTGFEGDVKFRGITSLENWGSRSHLLNAKRADDTYPFQGVFTPISVDRQVLDTVELTVQFLFICAPDKEARNRWFNRQNLKKELFELES